MSRGGAPQAEAAVFDASTPVCDAFGLTYASYFCVPRLVLQAMPLDWQRRFVALVAQLPATPEYAVQRRGASGRFEADPLRDYRRGEIPPEMASEIASNTAPAQVTDAAAASNVIFRARPGL